MSIIFSTSPFSIPSSGGMMPPPLQASMSATTHHHCPVLPTSSALNTLHPFSHHHPPAHMAIWKPLSNDLPPTAQCDLFVQAPPPPIISHDTTTTSKRPTTTQEFSLPMFAEVIPPGRMTPTPCVHQQASDSLAATQHNQHHQTTTSHTTTNATPLHQLHSDSHNASLSFTKAASMSQSLQQQQPFQAGSIAFAGASLRGWVDPFCNTHTPVPQPQAQLPLHQEAVEATTTTTAAFVQPSPLPQPPSYCHVFQAVTPPLHSHHQEAFHGGNTIIDCTQLSGAALASVLQGATGPVSVPWGEPLMPLMAGGTMPQQFALVNIVHGGGGPSSLEASLGHSSIYIPTQAASLHHFAPPPAPSFAPAMTLAANSVRVGNAMMGQVAANSGASAEGRALLEDLRRDRSDRNIAMRIQAMPSHLLNALRGTLEADAALVLHLCEHERGRIISSVLERCPAGCPAALGAICQHFAALAVTQRGCIALPRLAVALEGQPSGDRLFGACLEALPLLACDRYGNYVVSHYVNNGTAHVISRLAGRLAATADLLQTVALAKYGSFVVDGVLKRADYDPLVMALVNKVLLAPPAELRALCADPCGNYVVQAALDVVNRHRVDKTAYMASTWPALVSSPYAVRIASHLGIAAPKV